MSVAPSHQTGFPTGEIYLCAGGYVAIDIREADDAVVLTAARSLLFLPIETSLSADQAEHLAEVLLARAAALRTRKLRRRLAEIFEPFQGGSAGA